MKKIFKQNIIRDLKALSSKSFQELAWFPNDQNVVYSYYENIVGLFEDSALKDFLDAGEIVFGKKADDTLLELEAETSKIDGYEIPDDVILNMPQMQIIRQKAAEALALVLMSDGSESTVDIIDELPRAT